MSRSVQRSLVGERLGRPFLTGWGCHVLRLRRSVSVRGAQINFGCVLHFEWAVPVAKVHFDVIRMHTITVTLCWVVAGKMRSQLIGASGMGVRCFRFGSQLLLTSGP